MDAKHYVTHLNDVYDDAYGQRLQWTTRELHKSEANKIGFL